MKKIHIAGLLVCSVALLVACQNQNSSTKKVSSSRTTEVSQSSTSSVSSSNDDEKNTSTSSSENDESSTAKLGLSASTLYGYDKPDEINKYTGTYTGMSNDEETSKGIKIDLKINEDGTYRQVTTTYDYPADLGILLHGYFDSQGVFHKDKEIKTTINDKTYASIEGISYSEGILVENYGDIYFKPLMSVNSSLSLFLNEQGEMDEAKSVFRDSLRSWSRQGTNIIPTTEAEIESFYESAGLIYSSTGQDFQELFNLEDKIDADMPRISGVTLEKSGQVSELTTKPLEEVLNKEWFESWTKTTNGLYQFSTGSMLGAPSTDLDEKNYVQLDENAEIYTKAGDKVTTSVGYVEKIGSFSETADITYNNKVYENLSSKDGKYILDPSYGY